MELYLLRHGRPNSELVDPQKGLSPEGQWEIGSLGKLIKPLNIAVSEIWHSGKTRARQTAEIISSYLEVEGGIIEKNGLNPADRIEPIVGQILAHKRDLMIVGHAPFLPNLSSLLLTGDPNRAALDFGTGTLARLAHVNGRWTLSWLIRPWPEYASDTSRVQSYH